MMLIDGVCFMKRECEIMLIEGVFKKESVK